MYNSNITLSICIASYNKAKITEQLVNTILASDRADIEVVVSDNVSTDDTLERLNRIDDSRLHIFCNDNNIGGGPNMIQAVYHGKGKYVMYCNDRDLIFPQELPRFIDFLDENKVGGVFVYHNETRQSTNFMIGKKH